MVGVNCAGLTNKLNSLDYLLSNIQPTVFFIQETKQRRQGKIKTENSKNYQIFELTRKNLNGGGLAIGAVHDVEPVWISEGDDEVEVLVIQIRLGDIYVRCLAGYGPQEKDPSERKLSFWSRLSKEVIEAQENESAFILQMDGNLWAGNEVIKGDVRECNQNGKLLKDFLVKHPHLTVVNSLEICEGLITRRRKTTRGLEESVLDFFIVCDKMKAFLQRMIVDEDKLYALSKYVKVKGDYVKKDSDHNTLILYMNISYKTKKPSREEVFNFKNQECQREFFTITEETEDLSSCFMSNKTFDKQCKDWFKNLQTVFHKSFKKIRCQSRVKETEVSKLLEKRKNLIQKLKKAEEETKQELSKEIKSIEDGISTLSSEENRNKVIENFKHLENNDGSTNTNGIWKIMKKLFPKNVESLPFAKKNCQGQLISSQHLLKQLYLDTFVHRLRHRPIRDNLQNLKEMKEELCQKRLNIARDNKTPPWTNEQLLKVLSRLKNGKSRDPHGMVNELFKPGVCGKDLQVSLLMMVNQIKKEIFIPKFMEIAYIVSIYKGKGEKIDLQNDRGIFIVNLFRSILMKLVYGDKYELVDKNMSDSNVGARKMKNIRNHIFVLNGVINDVIHNPKRDSIDIEILDYRQCFDSMWMEEVLNDLWEAGIQDDNLSLIARVNESVEVSVKTPFGKTGSKEINNVVMQGEVFGPLCCSVQVDTFGKECVHKSKYLYEYKDEVGIPPLAMVDDLALISKCGLNSVLINGYINQKTNMKKLQFDVDKCHKMHIGQKNHLCPDLYIDNWEVKPVDSIATSVMEMEDVLCGTSRVESSEDEKYLGDIISHSGSNTKNIIARKAKGIGAVNKVMDYLEGTVFGPYYFEVAFTLRSSLVLSSILTNSEAWYGLSLAEIEQLEQVDEMLIRRILEVGQSCPKEMLYLETGCTPIRYIIMLRKIMFLHYILNEEQESLIHRVLKAQLKSPVKGDWILGVQEILIDLEIDLELEEIKQIKEETLRKFVKKQIKEKCLMYLNKQKEKHTKVMHIVHTELKMQNFLHPNHAQNIHLSKFLFSARSRMLDFRINFRKKYSDVKCPLGCDELDSQQHGLICDKIVTNVLDSQDLAVYEDLFSKNVLKQMKVAAILQERMKYRKVK